MLSKEQIKQVENSFSNGDDIVFQIENRVFVAEEVLKHKKEATIEFVNCQEIDESCFESNGEYYGDVLPETKTYILQDCYADNNNAVATYYYEDEIEEII